MKVTREKEAFRPITITLETHTEVYDLKAVLVESKPKDMAISSFADALYQRLVDEEFH